MNVFFLQKLFFYSLFYKIIFVASAGGQSQSNQIYECKKDLLTTVKELVDSVPKEISDPDLNADAIGGWHQKFAGILCCDCVNFDGNETKNFLDGKNQDYLKEIQRNFCTEFKYGNPMEKVMNKMEKYLVNFPKILEKIQKSIQKMVDEKQKLMQKNALIANENKEQFQMLLEQLNAAITMVSNLFIGKKSGGSNEMPLQRRRAKRMRSIEITSANTSQTNTSNSSNNNNKSRNCAKAFVGFVSFYYVVLLIPGIQFAHNQLNFTGIILIVIAAVIFMAQLCVAIRFKLQPFGNNNN